MELLADQQEMRPTSSWSCTCTAWEVRGLTLPYAAECLVLECVRLHGMLHEKGINLPADWLQFQTNL
jgi:hypothetical protein